MSTGRQARFSQNRAPRFPVGESVPPPRIPVGVARQASEGVRAEQQAEARKAEYIGNDSSFVRYGQLVPVVFPAIGVPAVVLEFIVPPGRVLAVSSVQWWLSEPFCYINDQFGWRLSIDAGQLPFHSSFNREDTHTFPLPIPGASGEASIFPVYVQENATVRVEFNEIQIIPVGPTAFESYLAATCWLFGKLLKPGGKSDG